MTSKLQKIEKPGSIITTSRAKEMGISRALLSKLCKENKIQRIARGQYTFTDDLPDELFSIGMRSNKIIFSHETALYLHGLSDRTPFEHTITAPSGCVPSAAVQSQCKTYFIKPELFELGKTEIKTPFGNSVIVYDPERTICDIVRSRSRIGSETFLAALKFYTASPQEDLNRLYEYAKQLRVSSVIRQYLEVML